ncbi:histidine phosphatase family protein [Salinibacterium sp. NSLL150]|uniref:histidine phosphatase family protein n=1 Tax=unclassified Salinibacterium TaxID=2632331 RepID=UPI0018CD2C81|nr:MULTISPECIES: histidine phosphatase family protein [unclassified Salinibacterium]MBH0100090.1 histidine phosphatase family protein [Salinibacterium sp. NSLL35]MBH0102844.1 histidine phosphatase family protein [Salinibacterium sp. NSLL150]MBH0105604.1 histidine phosphatase family protein [Salinibacterium sp. NSLL16]MBH0108364.1 histidine phosphatase family protein [Salinibacterium sp. NSLL17]MBH0111142.1 histidine phosphatase family protein [Salinibacterium sp. NG22]
MAHYLYLVRHGEQQDAEHGLPDGPLSGKGVRQAQAISERLSGVPFTRAFHSPLQRAEETAAIMTERMPALESQPTTLLMDCIPSGPTHDMPAAFEPFFGSVTAEEIDAGQAQMEDAVNEFLTPAREDRHDLLITHNFVISWFVREVLGGDQWRWLGLNQANCGLTIIRVRSAKPPVLVTHNDLGHLPAELRTGLPTEQPY